MGRDNAAVAAGLAPECGEVVACEGLCGGGLVVWLDVWVCTWREGRYLWCVVAPQGWSVGGVEEDSGGIGSGSGGLGVGCASSRGSDGVRTARLARPGPYFLSIAAA